MISQEKTNIKKDILSNGLRVISESIPYVRSISIGIWLLTGSRYEKSLEQGISHFLEHINFKGTEKRDARNIALTIESAGGILDAFTSRELTCYYVKLLDEDLELAIELLSDIILHSNYNPEDIDNVREVVLEELRLTEDTPDDIVNNLLTAMIWDGHPLGKSILGTRESLISFNREMILEYWRTHYIPSRMIITVAGNVNHNELLDLVRKYFIFNELPSSTSYPFNLSPLPTYKRNIKYTKKDISQMHIAFGTVAPAYSDKAHYPLMVFNTILSGGMGSRLFQTLREEQGLAYSVYSYCQAWQDTGLFGAYIATEASKTPEAIKSMIEQFRLIRDNELIEDELINARNHLKGNIILGLESMDARMGRLARLEIYDDVFKTHSITLKKIESVTKEQIQSLAKHIFTPESISLAMVGPEIEAISENDLII